MILLCLLLHLFGVSVVLSFTTAKFLSEYHIHTEHEHLNTHQQLVVNRVTRFIPKQILHYNLSRLAALVRSRMTLDDGSRRPLNLIELVHVVRVRSDMYRAINHPIRINIEFNSGTNPLLLIILASLMNRILLNWLKIQDLYLSIKCRHFRRKKFSVNLRVFISFTKQFLTFRECRRSWVRIPPRAKICYSHFTLLEWNVKNCFVKLIKTLKLVYLCMYSNLINRQEKTHRKTNLNLFVSPYPQQN